jgi:hypothetical protein
MVDAIESAAVVAGRFVTNRDKNWAAGRLRANYRKLLTVKFLQSSNNLLGGKFAASFPLIQSSVRGSEELLEELPR